MRLVTFTLEWPKRPASRDLPPTWSGNAASALGRASESSGISRFYPSWGNLPGYWGLAATHGLRYGWRMIRALRKKLGEALRARLDVPDIPRSLARLKRQGFTPNTVFDVGAYEGWFTRVCHQL